MLDTVGRFNLPLPRPTQRVGGGRRKGVPCICPTEPPAQNPGCSCVVACHTPPERSSAFFVFCPECPQNLWTALDPPGTPWSALDPHYTPKFFLLYEAARSEVLAASLFEPDSHAPRPCLDPLKLVLLTVLDLCLFLPDPRLMRQQGQRSVCTFGCVLSCCGHPSIH